MSPEKLDAPTVVLRRGELSATLTRWQLSWLKHSIVISSSPELPDGLRLCCGLRPSRIHRWSLWCAIRIRFSAAQCTTRVCIKRPRRFTFAIFRCCASTFVALDRARESTIAALANETTSAPRSIIFQENFRSDRFCWRASVLVQWWDCVWAARTSRFRGCLLWGFLG